MKVSTLKMKVVITIEQEEYRFILEYLHFKLPQSYTRRLCDNKITPVYMINEPNFVFEDLTFTITTFPEFQKFHYFRKYSELTIEGDYKCINDFIKNSIESITKCRFQNDVLIIYRSGYNSWNETKKLTDRNIDTVYLNSDTKKELIDDITQFYNNDSKNIYEMLNINHNRIYMFYGLPGTGKTTLIKSLASLFKKNIAYLVIKKDLEFDNLYNLMERLPNDTFIVLEDVDALFSEDRQQKSGITFSAFINVFDGITSSKDIVVFMTTNNLNSIDKAIIRRVSYFMEFKYATKDQIRQMFDAFYPQFSKLFETFWEYVKTTPITTNLLEKFFTKYLYEEITELGPLFSKFSNGELSLNSKHEFYV